MAIKSRYYLVLVAVLLITVTLVYDSSLASTKAVRSGSRDSIRIVHIELIGLTATRIGVVEKAIRVQGVRDCRIDLEQKEAVVSIDIQRTHLKQIRASLREVGITPIFSRPH
ncbi:hypothetical protein L0222_16850 [bacterium]|nr:hypothetical protein [bacterium]MCI0606153.1 hypothetical protein [bacterium]